MKRFNPTHPDTHSRVCTAGYVCGIERWRYVDGMCVASSVGWECEGGSKTCRRGRKETEIICGRAIQELLCHVPSST